MDPPVFQEDVAGDSPISVEEQDDDSICSTPNFTCSHCNESLFMWGGPVALACAHTLCYNCLEKAQDSSGAFVCPLCKEIEEWVPVSVSPMDIEEYERGMYENGNAGLFSRVSVSPDKKLGALLRGMKRVLADRRRKQEPADRIRRKQSLYVMTSFLEDVEVMRAVFDKEPPEWVPDSSSTSCSQCSATFKPVTCGRHHCRFCGQLFCNRCSNNRSLLPFKFRIREPQRVCDACASILEPGQTLLAFQVSHAFQQATHDVTDYSCARSWFNSPLGLSMQQEIYKATNTLRQFHQVTRLKPELSIPEAVLRNAKGLAILTVFKAGMGLTYKIGTGLVVSRLPNGTWSAPSAVASCGMGWGFQAGGELTDFVIVLRNEAAVKAFSSRVHFSVGAGISLAAGPVGRVAEADIRTGDGVAAACYTYSCSKGAFVGCSLESNIVVTRRGANASFYGDVYVTAKNILFGSVPQPKAALPLYEALSQLYK